MNRIMSRRIGIVLLGGLLCASCVSPNPQRGKRLSLFEAISILHNVEYVSEFEAAVGRKSSGLKFAYNDPDNGYRPFRRGKDYWNDLYVFSRPDLMIIVENGTDMFGYGYEINPPLNPTGGMLFIFADEQNRVIGWMYSNSHVGYEREAMPV